MVVYIIFIIIFAEPFLDFSFDVLLAFVIDLKKIYRLMLISRIRDLGLKMIRIICASIFWCWLNFAVAVVGGDFINSGNLITIDQVSL